MSNDFNSRRKTILEKRLAELYEEYDAAYAQLGRMLSDTDALKIKRQIAYLDEAIKEVEGQLAQLDSSNGGTRAGRATAVVPNADPVAMQLADNTYLLQLIDVINRRFNLSELRSFCLHLSIDLDDLPGEGKRRKVEELVTYLNRHLRLGELLRVGRRERPDIDWPEYNSRSN